MARYAGSFLFTLLAAFAVTAATPVTGRADQPEAGPRESATELSEASQSSESAVESSEPSSSTDPAMPEAQPADETDAVDEAVATKTSEAQAPMDAEAAQAAAEAVAAAEEAAEEAAEKAAAKKKADCAKHNTGSRVPAKKCR